jgi:hypothetical protein
MVPIYGAPEGKNEERDRLLHLLADYIADVSRLQNLFRLRSM